MICFGNVPAGSTLPIPFSSYGKTNGESITISGLAVTDIEVYKGTSMTQRASDSGYVLMDTDGIDLDGITGVNGFSIDLSDNTDAGFYAAGSFYWVIVSSITVDGQVVNFIAATFRIVVAENTAGVTVVDLGRWLGTVPLALTSQLVQVSIGALQAAVITAASIADNAFTAAKFAAGAFDAVWSVAARTLTSFGTLVADVATAVWGAAARTLTAATNITSTGGTTVPQTGDSFARLGAPAGASVSADIAAIKTVVDAILVDTGTTLDGKIDAIKAVTDLLPDGGALTSVALEATAQAIKTVTDQLVAAQAEPTGVPAANATPLIKLARLHQALRNRLDVDSNTGKKQFFSDAGAALWEKDFTDAGGVYSESEANAP